MNLDDESLLSAYLDGELDADGRAAVETALLSDAGLSDRLRELSAVRDLVAGLPRPEVPADLTSAVLARIGRRPAGRPWFARPPALARLGIAATVLVGLTLHLSLNRSPRRGPAVAPAKPIAAEASPTRSEPPTVAPRPLVRVADGSPREEVAPATAEPRRLPAAPVVADGAAARVRRMLDDPSLSKVLVVTDVIGGHAEERVDALIHRTPRTDPSYGRITIGQGIVVDPRHPHRATVFALAMDGPELQDFRAKLEDAFGAVEEPADRDVVTKLADVGQVAILPGTRAVELVPPDGLAPRLALRDAPDELTSPPADPPAEPGPGVPAPSPKAAIVAGPPAARDEAGRAGAEGAADRRPRRDDRDRARRRPSSVVLVWVTTREP
jgi:hypothetical protein